MEQSFNVNAYESETNCEVTLASGQVEGILQAGSKSN